MTSTAADTENDYYYPDLVFREEKKTVTITRVTS